MSDQFYAVQYHNMHNGGHQIAIYSLEEKAQQFHDYINEHGEPPESDEYYEPLNFIMDCEIDHRAPPTHTPDEYELRLIYVNDLDNRNNHIAPQVW